jgi:thioredoxin 1
MSKFTEAINAQSPTLVDFTAEWCGPCKTLAPILKDVAAEVKDKARILKVNIDKNPAAARFYQVQAVPTLILFKKGEIKWRQSGVVPGKMIVDEINKNL